MFQELSLFCSSLGILASVRVHGECVNAWVWLAMGDEIFAELYPSRAACRTRIRHCPHVTRDARCVCVFVNVRLFVVRVFVCYTTREKKRARDVRVVVCVRVLNEYRE